MSGRWWDKSNSVITLASTYTHWWQQVPNTIVHMIWRGFSSKLKERHAEKGCRRVINRLVLLWWTRDGGRWQVLCTQYLRCAREIRRRPPGKRFSVPWHPWRWWWWWWWWWWWSCGASAPGVAGYGGDVVDVADLAVLLESGGGVLLAYGSTANVAAFGRTDDRVDIVMDATDVADVWWSRAAFKRRVCASLGVALDGRGAVTAKRTYGRNDNNGTRRRETKIKIIRIKKKKRNK